MTKVVKEVVKETVVVAGTPKVVEKEVTRVVEVPAPAKPVEEKVTITDFSWGHWWEQDEGGPGQPYAKKWFYEDVKGIEVDYQAISYGDFVIKLRAMLPAGEAPDVLWGAWSIFYPYASTQYFMPLEDMGAATWDDWTKQFKPDVVKEIQTLG